MTAIRRNRATGSDMRRRGDQLPDVAISARHAWRLIHRQRGTLCRCDQCIVQTRRAEKVLARAERSIARLARKIDKESRGD